MIINFEIFAQDFIFKNNIFSIPTSKNLILESDFINFEEYIFKKPKIYFSNYNKDLENKKNPEKRFIFWDKLVFKSNNSDENEIKFEITSNKQFTENKVTKTFLHKKNITEIEEIFNFKNKITLKTNKYFITDDLYSPVFSEDDNFNIIQFKSDMLIDDNFFLISYPLELQFVKINIRANINGKLFTFFDNQLSTIDIGIIDNKKYSILSLNNFIKNFNLEDRDIVIKELIMFFDKNSIFDNNFTSFDKFELSLFELKNKNNYYNYYNYFEYFILDISDNNFLIFNNNDLIYSVEILNDNFININDFNYNQSNILPIKNYQDIKYYDDHIQLSFDISNEDLKKFISNNFDDDEIIYINSDNNPNDLILENKVNHISIKTILIKIINYFTGTLSFIFFYIFTVFFFSYIMIKLSRSLPKLINMNYIFSSLFALNILYVIFLMFFSNFTPFSREIFIFVGNILFVLYLLIFMYFIGTYMFNNSSNDFDE